MFTGIFKAVAVMSAEGAMLGLLLLLLKPLTKRIFGVKWQYYIWLTVLGVMLLPLSFFGNHKSSSAVGYIAATAQTAAVPHIGKTILTLAALIWCIGAAVSLGIRLFRYILFLRIIMRNSAPSQPIRVGTRILNTRRTQSLNAPILIGLFRPTLFLPDRDISEDAMSYILLHELTHYTDMIFFTNGQQCLPVQYIGSTR
jgi:beta-lactamase regulating signal transducer with metallopeptidase domain